MQSPRVLVAEEVQFSGHAMVRATHGSTIEVTTERHLSPSGDCIVGVCATKGLSQLSPSMKSALRSDSARVRITIVAPGGRHSFSARGSKDLPLSSPTAMVIRTSSFVCPRTLAVLAETPARGLPRSLVGSLKSPEASRLLRIEVTD
ncbi:MAG: DUF371 domain-containing protein [Nitrososphaerota archaeon]|nr:DUF371 domain-containing protein [Nitrososphaerota archaeon]